MHKLLLCCPLTRSFNMFFEKLLSFDMKKWLGALPIPFRVALIQVTGGLLRKSEDTWFESSFAIERTEFTYP